MTAGIATVGIAAASPLLAEKEFRCQAHNKYDDTGSAKPYEGPASHKWEKMRGDD